MRVWTKDRKNDKTEVLLGVCDSRRWGVVGRWIEKSHVKDASSNLSSIGQYVLTPKIFEILRGLSVGSGNEIQSADARKV